MGCVLSQNDEHLGKDNRRGIVCRSLQQVGDQLHVRFDCRGYRSSVELVMPVCFSMLVQYISDSVASWKANLHFPSFF